MWWGDLTTKGSTLAQAATIAAKDPKAMGTLLILLLIIILNYHS
jgi:hypothetical protein